MVNVGLRRKLNMKNYHMYGLIKPHHVYQACEYLIKHHPAYKNINLAKYDEWVKTCPTLFNHIDNSDDEEVPSDLDDEEKFDESSKTRANDKETHVRAEKSSDKTTANGESESNDYNAVTCLYPKEPETEMIVNHSDVRKRVKLKRKAKKIIDYAPGEK